MYEVHDPRFDPPGMPAEEPFEEERRGRGCLFWGCLITAAVVVGLTLITAASLYFAARYVLNNFTDERPAAIEVVQLPDDRLAEIVARVERFEQTLDLDAKAEEPAKENAPEEDLAADAPAPPVDPLVLELTADELNGLINQNEDVRGRLFVRLKQGRVVGEVSLPADALPGGKGRYLNGSVEFDVSLRDGVLDVRLVRGEANGLSIPPNAIDKLAEQNLAEGLDDSPEFRRLMEKVDSLEVIEDRIVLRAKAPPETESDAEVAAEIESFEEVD